MTAGRVFSSERKLLYHSVRVAQWLDGQSVFPIMVGIDPSNLCNHDCVWCSYQPILPQHQLLEPELMLAVIRQLANCGVMAIQWSGGGEPTVHPQLAEAMRLAHSLGLQQALYTNGQLCRGHLVECVREMCEYVRFSMDAASDQVYARGHKVAPGTFEKVLRNIQDIARRPRQMTVGVSFLVHKWNYTDVEDAAALFREVGVDYLELKPAVKGPGDPETSTPEWWTQEVLARLAAAKAKETSSFAVHVIDQKFDNLITLSDRSYDACLGQSFVSLINSDGIVYVCCNQRSLSDFALGDLHHQTFREIWLGPNRQELVSAINVHACPINCKLDKINRLLWEISHKDRSSHPNFL